MLQAITPASDHGVEELLFVDSLKQAFTDAELSSGTIRIVNDTFATDSVGKYLVSSLLGGVGAHSPTGGSSSDLLSVF